MQIVPSESMAPYRLTCSGCQHWERTLSARADADSAGRCDRFGETRPASARPRCNICWEPATPAPQDVGILDT